MTSSSDAAFKQNLFADIQSLLDSLAQRRVFSKEIAMYRLVLNQDVVTVLSADDLERFRARLEAWDLEAAWWWRRGNRVVLQADL